MDDTRTWADVLATHRDRLVAIDRKGQSRLVARAEHTARTGGEVTVSDLVIVLFQVLADGLRRGTEEHDRMTAAWETVPNHAEVVAKGMFARQAFLLECYGTVVGIERGLSDPERTLVRRAFLREGGGLVRLRPGVPSRWRMNRTVEDYERVSPPASESFVPAAVRFVEHCSDGASPEPFAASAPALAAVALDLFYAAATGTANAVRSWQRITS